MVYALGESLLDIIFTEANEITAKAGGGMLNTSVSLGRCGIDVSLISELGDDNTAMQILGFLKSNRVNTRFIKKYYRQNSSVALAYLNKEKIPTFSIYKSYPNKRKLQFPTTFSEADLLVFGSLYSLDPAIRNEVKEIIVRAKQSGAFILYDPNIRRHNLDEPRIKQALRENIAFADIVKGSEEDFRNIFGNTSPGDYSNEIQKINPSALFILTRGENGVSGYDQNIVIDLPAFETEVISTIGAGDAFSAGLVFYLEQLKNKKEWFENKSDVMFRKMLDSGLKFSAKVCSTIDNYIAERPSF